MDFGEINFTLIDAGARLLSDIDVSWANEIGQSPVIPYADQLVERPEGRPDMSDKYASEWVRGSSIDLHPAVRPYVINSLMNYDSSPPDNNDMVERCSKMSTQIAQHGGRENCQLATAAALDSLGNPGKRAGRQQITVLWGGGINCIDFPSHELQVGDIRYNAADSGDCITLSAHLQKALGEPNKEVGHCALLHLAEVYEWGSQNCPNRAPSNSRINVAAWGFRKIEYRIALRFVSTLKHPSTPREYEMWSVSPRCHDAKPRSSIPGVICFSLNIIVADRRRCSPNL